MSIKKPQQRLLGIYDLEVSPETFDLFGFIVLLHTEFVSGDYDILSIILIPGSRNGFRGDCNVYELEEQLKRREKLLLPLIRNLLPFAKIHLDFDRDESLLFVNQSLCAGVDVFPEDYTASNPTTKFSIKHLCKSWDRTKYRPTYKAKTLVRGAVKNLLTLEKSRRKKDQKTISVTLRNSSSYSPRNSNISAWNELVSDLEKAGHLVVVIPDTESIENTGQSSKGFTFVDAALDIEIRHSVYETCDLNLFVNNGPAMFSYYGVDKPYLVFKLICAEVNNSDISYFFKEEFYPGDHWPGAKKLQQLVWETDSKEVLSTAVRLMLRCIDEEEIGGNRLWCDDIRCSLRNGLFDTANALSATALSFWDDSIDVYIMRAEVLLNSCRPFEAILTLLSAKRKGIPIFDHLSDIVNHGCMDQFEAWITVIRRYLLGDRGLPFSPTKWVDFEKSSFELKYSEVSGFYIFGAGMFGKQVYENISNRSKCLGFLDNDPEKEGLKFCGLNIGSPQKINDDAVVFIASMYSVAIYSSLINSGFPAERIFICPSFDGKITLRNDSI